MWVDTAKDLQAHSSAVQQAQRGHSGGLAPSPCCQSHHIASGSQDGRQLAGWRTGRQCRAEVPPAVLSGAGCVSGAGRYPGRAAEKSVTRAQSSWGRWVSQPAVCRSYGDGRGLTSSRSMSSGLPSRTGNWPPRDFRSGTITMK